MCILDQIWSGMQEIFNLCFISFYGLHVVEMLTVILHICLLCLYETYFIQTSCMKTFCYFLQENVSDLLPVFEDFLSNAPGTASYDAVRQSIVILMGSLAKHLDKDNPKVKPIVGQLISALSTPSQEVSCLF